MKRLSDMFSTLVRKFIPFLIIGIAALVFTHLLVLLLVALPNRKEHPVLCAETYPVAGTSATTDSSVPVQAQPVLSTQPITTTITVLELLPEHAIYVSGPYKAIIDSRASAYATGRAWNAPYPYQLLIAGGDAKADCGFFPTLQGTWRTAYCLDGNARHPQKLYIWEERGTYTFNFGGTTYKGFSIASSEEASTH